MARGDRKMKTLGIEKRSAILYVRIKPSVLKMLHKLAKRYAARPADIIEQMIIGRTQFEARLADNKPKKSKKRA